MLLRKFYGFTETHAGGFAHQTQRSPASSLRIASIATGAVILVLAAAVAWWLMRPKAIEVQTAVAREITNISGDGPC